MEPLTKAQQRELEGDLRALERELDDALGLSADATKPVDLEEPIGRLSRMDAMQQQKMAEATHRNHTARLGKVRSSLIAIGEGAYGECRNCDEPIGYKRLKARPEVAICVRCQSELEQR